METCPNSSSCTISRSTPPQPHPTPHLQSLTAVHPQTILLVGNPMLPLKGFEVAVKALELVNQTRPIHVTWICQT